MLKVHAKQNKLKSYAIILGWCKVPLNQMGLESNKNTFQIWQRRGSRSSQTWNTTTQVSNVAVTGSPREQRSPGASGTLSSINRASPWWSLQVSRVKINSILTHPGTRSSTRKKSGSAGSQETEEPDHIPVLYWHTRSEICLLKEIDYFNDSIIKDFFKKLSSFKSQNFRIVRYLKLLCSIS